MILDERILRLVLTLAEELHFGRAAARLHVSQPTLSGAVKNVERDLGVQLFNRSSRRVELTDAGNTFVVEARRLVDQAERTVALVRGGGVDFAGPLRVGYSPDFNLKWFCSLISRTADDPHLATAVEFVSAEPVDVCHDLVKGTLHAGFLMGHVTDPELHCVPLFRERFAVALNSTHPLSNRTRLTFNQLQGEPAVWLRRDLNPSLYDSFLDVCSSHGYHPAIVQEVRTFYECVQFVREGLGITFLPSFLRGLGHYEGIVFGTLLKSLYVDAALVFRRDNRADAVKRFIRFVRHNVPEHNGVVRSAAC
jgi:DNA-binding transcriptional LysR family regulator